MGSKKKFWLHFSDDQKQSWLFKYPRLDSGEHWAEKIAEQICSILEINHARVKLAELRIETKAESRGSISKSFVKNNEFLLHGNQILASIVNSYDTQKKKKQTKHTLKNIFFSMGKFILTDIDLRAAKRSFAEYLVLDALIGNTDRHHENWGMLVRHEHGRYLCQLAPSFDHASSLGRELQDVKRRQKLSNNEIANYSRRGRGAVFWSEDDNQCPNPIQLIQLALAEPDFRDEFRHALNKVSKLDDDLIQSVIFRVPHSWMTQTEREFALELMKLNLDQLYKLI